METVPAITVETIRELILRDNPRAHVSDVEQYAHLLLSYLEASESILRLGTITAHPRTGAPIENPYLKVRASTLSSMNRLTRLRRLDSLWKMIAAYLDLITKKES